MSTFAVQYLANDLTVARFLRLPPTSDHIWVLWQGNTMVLPGEKYTIACHGPDGIHYPLRYIIKNKLTWSEVMKVYVYREIIQKVYSCSGLWIFCETTGRFLYALTKEDGVVFLSQSKSTRAVRLWKRNRAAKQQLLAQVIPACLTQLVWSFL